MIPILMVVLVLPVSAGSPAQATAAKRVYEKEVEAWQLKIKQAKTDQQRMALLQVRPDPKVAAARMWKVIQPDLAREWAIEPAAWFLQMANASVEQGPGGAMRPAFPEQMKQVKAAVEQSHLESSQLAPMCMALVGCGDNASLLLLRKIEKENPDKVMRGVAALGIAMLAKSMGDDPKVIRERLSMLRRAIIDSADVQIGTVTVAQLVREELYIINNLSKGVVAPNLEGLDSAGRPMKLADYTGKVVMLVFWNSVSGSEQGVLELAKALRKDPRFAGKKFEVVGVNSDSTKSLWKRQNAKELDWPNFSDPDNQLGKIYRVGNWPLVYVLGPDRKIHYVGAMGTFAELTAAAVLSES